MAKERNTALPKLDNVRLFSKQIAAYIVHSNWHKTIIDKMCEGAVNILNYYGIRNIQIIPVSGTFEIPQMVSHIIKSFVHRQSHKENGEVTHALIITLGVVIQGETYHDKVISYSVANAIQNIAIAYPSVPIGFGILTVYNKQQAIERSFGNNNKGVEAAIAALTQLDKIISLGFRMDNRGQVQN